MPELPEVETFVRSLREGGMSGAPIINRQISSVDLFWQRTLALGGTIEDVNAALKGKMIDGVSRRAKYICVSAEGENILFHLRMSGDLRCEEDDAQTIRKHDRLVIHFSDGMRLAFNDVRKFGRVWVTPDTKLVLGDLGIEPLSEEFNGEWLYEHLQGKKQKIKPLLLDQHFIAGVGNIYSDEALFIASVHPQRIAASLSREEAQALCEAVRAVLQKGIAKNGASFDWAYKGGSFQNDFQVYQQTGNPCPRCGTTVERIVVGQRGTHFCPKCQKLTD